MTSGLRVYVLLTFMITPSCVCIALGQESGDDAATTACLAVAFGISFLAACFFGYRWMYTEHPECPQLQKDKETAEALARLRKKQLETYKRGHP